MRKVRERVLARFTEDQWLNALEAYAHLDVSFFYLSMHRLRHSEYVANDISRSGKLLAAATDWCSLTGVTTRRKLWTFEHPACNDVAYIMYGSGVFGILM
jgi:hypothetical protein